MLSHADKYSPAFSRAAYEKLQRGEIPQNELWKYSSYWHKDFDSMAKKTMLRQLISKWGIMSLELQQAISSDGATIEKQGTDFVPNFEEQPEIVENAPVIESNAETSEPEAVNINDI